jgi:hypothetical protein
MVRFKGSTFKASIRQIGVNPYVSVPVRILSLLFISAGKNKGAIPVKLFINGKGFIQHLVKFRGAWRLYLNTPMRRHAAKAAGDLITIGIAFDPGNREEPVNEKFEVALVRNKKAKDIYNALSPSLKKEMNRYLNRLKTDAALERNIKRSVSWLLGRERFIGRENPG